MGGKRKSLEDSQSGTPDNTKKSRTVNYRMDKKNRRSETAAICKVLIAVNPWQERVGTAAATALWEKAVSRLVSSNVSRFKSMNISSLKSVASTLLKLVRVDEKKEVLGISGHDAMGDESAALVRQVYDLKMESLELHTTRAAELSEKAKIDKQKTIDLLTHAHGMTVPDAFDKIGEEREEDDSEDEYEQEDEVAAAGEEEEEEKEEEEKVEADKEEKEEEEEEEDNGRNEIRKKREKIGDEKARGVKKLKIDKKQRSSDESSDDISGKMKRSLARKKKANLARAAKSARSKEIVARALAPTSKNSRDALFEQFLRDQREFAEERRIERKRESDLRLEESRNLREGLLAFAKEIASNHQAYQQPIRRDGYFDKQDD